jgi:hypothetical protein
MMTPDGDVGGPVADLVVDLGLEAADVQEELAALAGSGLVALYEEAVDLIKVRARRVRPGRPVRGSR